MKVYDVIINKLMKVGYYFLKSSSLMAYGLPSPLVATAMSSFTAISTAFDTKSELCMDLKRIK